MLNDLAPQHQENKQDLQNFHTFNEKKWSTANGKWK